MKAQYQISEDDYASLARFHAWRHFIARPPAGQFVAGGILVVLLGIGLWTFPAVAPIFAVSIAISAVLYAAYLFVIIPSRARRHYRQYKAVQDTIAVELTEAGLKFSTTDGEGILPWSKIFQWRQNDRFILIYGMPILYYTVPKAIERQGFDVPRLVQYLAKQVGPER